MPWTSRANCGQWLGARPLVPRALARHPPITADAELCLFQGANPNALKVPEGTAPILQRLQSFTPTRGLVLGRLWTEHLGL